MFNDVYSYYPLSSSLVLLSEIFFSLIEVGKRKHKSGWEERVNILPSHKGQEFPRF